MTFSYELFSLIPKLFYEDAYSEPSPTSEMELFAKIVNSFLVVKEHKMSASTFLMNVADS